MAIHEAWELEKWLDVVIAKAPQLHAAGVVELELDGLKVRIVAGTAASGQPSPRAVAKSHIDPLRDPSTYPGGRVPGFPAPRKEDE